jgi:Ni,Fe-hydrogenase III large subunit
VTRPAPAPAVVPVDPARWRGAVRAALEGGERFCGGYAQRVGAATELRTVWAKGAAARILSCIAGDGTLPTIVDLVPAAGWDEREAADLYGLRFAGHEPHRALARHPDELDGWTTDVRGDGVHQVAVGPIHAGVIESGHFRFHVVGERILLVDPRLFYKHRGLERAAEGGTVERALAHAGRACGACAVSNSVACATAAEQALGLWPSGDTRRARTLLLELERVYNHLNDIGAVCAGVGFAPGAMSFAALKERALRLNAGLAGHRFLFGSVGVGGSDLYLSDPGASTLRAALAELETDFERSWRELRFSASLQARLDGVGVLEEADAVRLGAVGPTARASGVAVDARSAGQRLHYPTAISPRVPAAATGDVAARLEVRALELRDSFALLGDLLRHPVRPGDSEQRAAGGGVGIARVESPRGETTCTLELHDATVGRLHLRTGSYANWPALAHATVGNILPDFPLINKSFELCYACVDR